MGYMEWLALGFVVFFLTTLLCLFATLAIAARYERKQAELTRAWLAAQEAKRIATKGGKQWEAAVKKRRRAEDRS